MDYAIETSGLSKHFGATVAFDNVDLQVEPGQLFGLLGPDGAGKTSLIRVLLDIYEKSGGVKRILGKENFDQVRDHVGYVPQRFSLYSDLTVWENIELFGSLYGANREQIRELGDFVLEFTQLIQFKNRLAGNLSGGMKQKLALAAGLLHKPKILFMDEPTTGVDPVSRRQFWQMLYRLREQGMTIFVSTPYMDEAELCNKTGFMLAGRLIAQNTPVDMKKSFPYIMLETMTASRVAARLLAQTNWVKTVNVVGEKLRVAVQSEAEGKHLLAAELQANNLGFSDITRELVTMEDVFVYLAGLQNGATGVTTTKRDDDEQRS
ncbi:MAG: ABC transporter ATP-binding protein [Bacillota bacterium]